MNTASTKTYAWSIANTQDGITVNDLFQDGTQTARQVWQSCEGTDACPGTSDDKTLASSETTINGLNAYTATEQNSNGTYHVTVIRGNKTTSEGTAYVMFTTYSTDQAALATFAAIMASATFPN